MSLVPHQGAQVSSAKGSASSWSRSAISWKKCRELPVRSWLSKRKQKSTKMCLHPSHLCFIKRQQNLSTQLQPIMNQSSRIGFTGMLAETKSLDVCPLDWRETTPQSGIWCFKFIQWINTLPPASHTRRHLFAGTSSASRFSNPQPAQRTKETGGNDKL